MKLKRYEGNPILAPHPNHAWEDLAVFNPAAWYDEEAQEFRLLYRAAESGAEYKCRFGLARSKDGRHFERDSDQPAMDLTGEGFDGATIQDPRVVKIGDWYYLTYACRHYPFGQFWIPEVRQRFVKPAEAAPEFPHYLRSNATLTGLAMTRDFKGWIRAGWITNPLLDDRDAILFPEKVNGRFVLIHRPLEWVGPDYDTEHACAWIAFSEDLMGFPFAKSQLLIKNRFAWETMKMGVNTPPIKTPDGWFTLYHAVGPDKFYRLGALLLDLNDPSIVLHRTPDWLMQPEADYELDGYYRGVCFPCGTVVKDGTLHVYYGGADRYCALATCDFQQLLEHLKGCPA